MTKEEFKQRKYDLYDEYNAKKTALLKEYRDSNAIAKIGDVIKDKHGCSIIIESVECTDYESPSIYYYGKLLNKNGTINKRGETRALYEVHITEINGNPINPKDIF
jgi:hypothetical protein